MTADSRGSRDIPSEHAPERLQRTLFLALTAALIGVALSAVIAYIHTQLDQSGGQYTSFCNVNKSINCDRVLSSPFARIVGVPVAWLALLSYLGLALAYLAATTTSAPAARRALQVACSGSIAAAVFSAYMAGVSLAVLKTVCVMCTGLYVVSLILAGAAMTIPKRYALAYPSHGPLFVSRALLGIAVLSLVGTTALARLSWPTATAASADAATLAELRAQHPEFFDWYIGLQTVEVPPLRSGLGSGPIPKVTIIEFFDFACAYCRRSHALTSALQSREPDRVRVIPRHFPLDSSCNEAVPTTIHPASCRGAEAAECARKQGRFNEMADVLFEQGGRLYDANLIHQAKKLGFDVDAFTRCLNDHSTLGDVIEDCRAGAKLAFTSTPTLLFNGRLVMGTFDEPWGYDYAVAIESLLAAGQTWEAARATD